MSFKLIMIKQQSMFSYALYMISLIVVFSIQISSFYTPNKNHLSNRENNDLLIFENIKLSWLKLTKERGYRQKGIESLGDTQILEIGQGSIGQWSKSTDTC